LTSSSTSVTGPDSEPAARCRSPPRSPRKPPGPST
jgi:hypothetical protein